MECWENLNVNSKFLFLSRKDQIFDINSLLQKRQLLQNRTHVVNEKVEHQLF